MERQTSSVGYTYYNTRSPDGKSPSKTGTKMAPYSSNKSRESNKNLSKAKVVSEAQLAKMDVVSENKIWIETVQREKDLVKSWKPNWGFMTEFDQKGRAKVAAKLPEKVVMFSTNKRINTTSGEYGSYIYSPSSHKIQNLEIKFSETNRKKRLNSEFLCQ